MNWIPLQDIRQIEEIDRISQDGPVLIFKHSTSCSISSMAKLRLEEEWNFSSIPVYYLDLIAFRAVSNHLAEHYQVYHESPQIILVYKGESLHDASHFDISASEIKDVLEYNRFDAIIQG